MASSFNAFGSKTADYGQLHTPVWLGTVRPMPVGGVLAEKFRIKGLHIPAGTGINIAGGVITPFITYKVKTNTAGTGTYVLTLDPTDVKAFGYVPKVGDYLQLVDNSSFGSNGTAAAITAVAPNATDASLVDVTVNINAAAGRCVVLNFANAKIAAPNAYLYNDIFLGDLDQNENLNASGAAVNFHGEGILIQLTPCAVYAAAMAAAVPTVVQVVA